jgi:hypothetical protein
LICLVLISLLPRSKVSIVAVSRGQPLVARSSLLGSILAYALLVRLPRSTSIYFLTGILLGSGQQLFHSRLRQKEAHVRKNYDEHPVIFDDGCIFLSDCSNNHVCYLRWSRVPIRQRRSNPLSCHLYHAARHLRHIPQFSSMVPRPKRSTRPLFHTRKPPKRS